jgi:urease accessory protein
MPSFLSRLTSGLRFAPAVVLGSFLLFPAAAYAHPGHELAQGAIAGGLHPLSGLDHLCAMIAVGLWAAQQGGRHQWALPLSFWLLMLLGGAVGSTVQGLPFPAVESAILASVVVLGLLIASRQALPLVVGSAIAGGFALFHGYAHGAEMPATVAGWTYGLGFALTSAALLGGGWLLGRGLQHFSLAQALRWCGMVIVGCGLYLTLA